MTVISSITMNTYMHKLSNVTTLAV